MIDSKNIPKLRFPGFSGEWEVKKLGDVTHLFSNRNKELRAEPIYSVTNSKGFVLQTDHFSKSVAGDDLSSYKIVHKGDFAYNPARINVGSIARLEDEIAVISSLYVCFKANKDMDGDFLNHFLHKDSTMYSYGVFGEGGVRIYLWYPLFSMIPINVPEKKEQEKIADFLTAVDERIGMSEKKLELLETYKRGVMQKIFSQQIRFKDENGKSYPDWEEKKLKEVVEFIQNGLSVDQGAKGQGKKVTRIETISNNEIDPSKVGYIVTNKDISHYKLKKGDMLFSNINSPAHIGRIVYVKKDYDDIYHGMNLLRIRINELNNAKYLYYVLSSAEYKKWFERICNKAVNQASINQTDLGCTEIVLPKLDEQQKIADFLTTLDARITAEKSKLTAARQFKKALLQRMFV